MQKFALFFMAAAVIAGSTSCKNAGFNKAEHGTWYKIIHGASDTGSYAMNGTVIKFDITFKYGDSVLRTTVGQMPAYAPVDSARLPEPYYRIFSKVRAGDSVVVKQLTDSIFHNQPMPAFAKKNNYITSFFKIRAVFQNQAEGEADAKQEGELIRQQDSIKAIAQQKLDDQTIEAYLAKNNIKATKSPKGTYVEILDPGTGSAIDSSKEVGVNYTGRTLGGDAFDSNTDSTFHHKGDTLKVNMSLSPNRGGMITGFTDGILLLHKGAKARLYIPSALGYGSYGREPKIKPNENLIFDIEVLSVDTVHRYQPMGMGRPGGGLTPEMMAKIRAMQQAQAAKKGQAPAGH
ncbi:FKBP-type peptidyl-prolyl cis-trans isomerase [Dinghuibacter silviterrae]|uniref:peptidylprolyl isomerase n=1 Tax=Dinghuibacter silviterrae TaxID=1539049 RepID=A0A4R8DWU9_9BACT|nr:FKBP-type peptidyl-prolyl cis-trans isomerase [Dinghuibacter silviterrae]TDX01691.1 FKBP-type peptidyl-prolyl cis-trans isomerase [Dinghuibacter silviterrae]